MRAALGLRKDESGVLIRRISEASRAYGVLKRGEEFARERAQSTMESVRAVLGLAR